MSEEWRAIPGLDGYEVSNLGRVRSYRAHGGKRRLAEPRMKLTRPNQQGYRSVVLQLAPGKARAVTVHSLVALAFLGPRPDGCQVAHGDGDRMNSNLANLRYATPSENQRDRWLHGTQSAGERNGRAKLTEPQVREVVARYGRGEFQRELAAAYGVCTSTISNIVRRYSWAHVHEVTQ